jgi:hypothetical protein
MGEEPARVPDGILRRLLGREGVPPHVRMGAELDYLAWFEGWARDHLAAMELEHPDAPPFPLEDFDGCTMVPDFCLHCCLAHDAAYHFRGPPSEKDWRLEADRALERCVRAMGRLDGRPGKAWWALKARVIFLAVRCGGWLYIHRRHSSVEGATPPRAPPDDNPRS